MSSTDSQQNPAPQVPPRADTRSHRSNAPSPSSESPTTIRDFLTGPEIHINDSPAPIPTVEDDEPPSEFYDNPRVQDRVIRNRARLNLINGGGPAAGIVTPVGSAAASHPLPVNRNLWAPPVVRSPNEHPHLWTPPTANVGETSNSEPHTAPLRYSEFHFRPSRLSRSESLPTYPTENAGASSSARAVPITQQDRDMSERLRRGLEQYPFRARRPHTFSQRDSSDELGFHPSAGPYATHPRDRFTYRQSQGRRRQHRGSRPLPTHSEGQKAGNDWDSSSVVGGAEHLGDSEHMQGFEMGFEKGKEVGMRRGSLSYKVKCYFELSNMRMVIMGLAFVAYGLQCGKWADAMLYILLGWNTLATA
ncbi:uncharacterized protein RCC_08941 [Ramularia collo-cygni]|uniref:Uncharacterized protein n=1 Tax=Ramularia collo-cygni TaxID=112498 RepID=A0A2D3V8I5_9PEZI|nr:uncharacterized protein RCC_08941 [Ramularia collo-cygni]CZT23230.1 uncharacterized protein RCC_08941 [Ramularia collo-cygni]